MKYVDNLLDWGDSLFSRFTMESVNEATMLYVAAADILGPRPAALGSCMSDPVDRTYEDIERAGDRESEFLVEVESRLFSQSGTARGKGIEKSASIYSVLPEETIKFLDRDVRVYAEKLAIPTMASVPSTASWQRSRGKEGGSIFGSGVAMTSGDGPGVEPWPYDSSKKVQADEKKIPWDAKNVALLSQAFCLPPNENLRSRWDRVEDRLYKIRHCKDITGADRQLALFAPEIDPALLVRAKAAGLSMEDVLLSTSGELPPYRFNYLIEKAKQYSSTVQTFGTALLGALEKKDVADLERLRSLHEQNLLALGTRSREREIEVATEEIAGLERLRTSIQHRHDHYQQLMDGGLNAWEWTQASAIGMAGAAQATAASLALTAALLRKAPDVGSPFAMKYGGTQIGESLSIGAMGTRDLAGFSNSVATGAGLEAGYSRREEEWKFQAKAAELDLKQNERQLAAASLRRDIAVRSLEIHKKTIEQQKEIFDFLKDRFSNLGLYNWLSSSLQRLYRDAFNCAYSMARLAEQAYLFERGVEETRFLDGSYWDASNGGLLAGERLLLSLQQMEARFIETNYRSLEIDQAFSLRDIAPGALLSLQETGACDFEIPELSFDLLYPGQFKRRLKSARLSMPCVTGSSSG